MAISGADTDPAGRLRLRGRLHAAGSSQVAAGAVGLLLVAASTVVVAVITPSVPVDAAGVFYLVAVLAVSSIYGVWWGLATSLASALAYNFFFLPPLHTLVIDSSSDWLALAAFVITALVTSNLAARVRWERDEAARRAVEAQLGESFATMVADSATLDEVLPALARQASRALGAEDGAIHLGSRSEGRAGVLPLELGDRELGELRLMGAPPGLAESADAKRIARAVAGLIVLGEERERRRRHQVEADALAQSNELKTALLRAVSHDMRSPLQAIATAADGLSYADLDADERELLQTITDQGSRMSRMIENLIDLSTLQAGAARPAADWIDPRELAEAAVDEAAGSDERRVALDLHGDVPLVRGDGSQLQRVLVNLIENALKFSPADQPVSVSVSRVRRGVEIAVEDRGPGIPAEQRERIFEPFVRLQRAPGVAGSGLGLAIARGLAVANEGTLTVGARDGGGSRFALILPNRGATG